MLLIEMHHFTKEQLHKTLYDSDKGTSVEGVRWWVETQSVKCVSVVVYVLSVHSVNRGLGWGISSNQSDNGWK